MTWSKYTQLKEKLIISITSPGSASSTNEANVNETPNKTNSKSVNLDIKLQFGENFMNFSLADNLHPTSNKCCKISGWNFKSRHIHCHCPEEKVWDKVLQIPPEFGMRICFTLHS